MARQPGTPNKPKTRMISIAQLNQVFAPTYMVPIDRVLADSVFGPEDNPIIIAVAQPVEPKTEERIDDEKEILDFIPSPVLAVALPEPKPTKDEEDGLNFVFHAVEPVVEEPRNRDHFDTELEYYESLTGISEDNLSEEDLLFKWTYEEKNNC